MNQVVQPVATTLPGGGMTVSYPSVTLPAPMTPGLSTSEGKLVFALVGLLQLIVAIWAVVLQTGLVTPTAALAAAVPGVAEVLSTWLAAQYSGDRTSLKVAAL